MNRRFTVVVLWLLLLLPSWAQTVEEVVHRIQLVELALELGNQKAAKICLKQLDIPDATLARLFTEAGLSPDKVAEFRRETELARLTSLEMSGLHSQVLEEGKKLLPELRGEQELHLLLLLLQAGRKGAYPEAVSTYLPRAEKLALSQETPFAQLARFQISALKPHQDVLEEALRAWELWRGLPLGNKDFVSRQWRWGLEAVGLWREALLERYNPGDPKILEFLELQEKELSQRARAEYQEYRKTFDINIGYLLGLAQESLRDSHRYRALGMTEKAESRMARAQTFDPGIFHTKMTNRALQYGWREEGAFPFTQYSEFYVGNGLYYLAQAQAGNEVLENLESAAAQFTKAHHPVAEVDFLVEAVELLLAQRPSGWEAPARAWSRRSLEMSRSLNYRPGLIRSLINQGELESSTELLQTAVNELEKEPGTVSDGYLLRRYQRAYELLTQQRIKGGDSQKALEAQLRERQLAQITQVVPQEPALGRAVRANQRARARLRAAEAEESVADSKLSQEPRARFYRTLDQIKKLNPRYADYLTVRPLNFARLQASIPNNAALIVIAPGEEVTHLFVLTDQLVVRSSPVGYQELAKEVRRFRRQVTASRDSSADGQSLYQALIAPLEADIQGKEVLAFVPTRILNYLPFQALSKDGKFLVERFQVATILKDSDLDSLTQPPSTLAGPLFAFGNPDGSLPAAAEEARKVGGLFGQGQVFVETQATKARLSEVQEQVQMLHLATHGVLNSRSPENSYLILAGDNLSLSEIYGLNLKQAALITLSACETSVGEFNPGSEVSSLAGAFTIAGAQSPHSPTVLASLWKVEDRATSLLMTEFYSQLKAGVAKGEALRRAQLKLLGDPQTRDPYFWAPFIMIGDWR